jgi:hypothetical protein
MPPPRVRVADSRGGIVNLIGCGRDKARDPDRTH